MHPILEVTDLRKHFATVEAVRGISFQVQPGTCFGLLGPNGAGKTTTLEIIENILTPTSGEVLYDGARRTATFREEVGIQFQHTSLLNFLSVEETLNTFARLYHQPANLEVLIERCDLSGIRARRNDRLSGGQKQRLMLALALVNKPRLVFLDEPSTGLDPQSRRNLWKIVNQLKNEGRTMILTTHSMEEAEFLCDTIAIMDQGKIVASGSPSDLIKRHGGLNSILLPRNTCCPRGTLPLPLEELDDDTLVIHVEEIHQALNTLMHSGVDLRGISIHSPNLEDVFLNITGKRLRE